uniref:Uncharacterized protein n=1 Tax=Quercus lobata TaxID=97700 RepID=A0A7N2L3J4_QUELO
MFEGKELGNGLVEEERELSKSSTNKISISITSQLHRVLGFHMQFYPENSVPINSAAKSDYHGLCSRDVCKDIVATVDDTTVLKSRAFKELEKVEVGVQPSITDLAEKLKQCAVAMPRSFQGVPKNTLN